MEPPIHAAGGPEPAPEPEPSPGPLPSAEQISATLAPPVIRYGGFWRRSGAFLLDAFVISIVSVPANILTLVDYGSVTSTLVTIVTVVVGLAYLPFCWARFGRTVGYALMGLRIVRLEDGKGISWWRALGRFLAYYFAFVPFGLGILWIGWEPRKRGWHDRLADTLVLKVPSLRESHSSRRKWALTAVMVGVACFVFSAGVGVTVGIASATHGYRDAEGNLRGTQVLGLSALQAGDCFDPFLLSLQSVSATRCSELHTYEVFAAVKMRSGSYPSASELQQFANDDCIPSFEKYVGIDFAQSSWSVSYLGPDEGSWLLGKRILTCFLANQSETRMRGSAQGSAR